MTQEHPITPPSEDHVLKWSDEWFEAKVKHMTREKHLCMQAARWGADQQLAKDAKWLDHNALSEPHLKVIPVGESLKEAMRPKPPTKEEALDELILSFDRGYLKKESAELIRRALESLPD